MEFLYSALLWLGGVVGYENPPPNVTAPVVVFKYYAYLDKIVCPISDLFPWGGEPTKLPLTKEQRRAGLPADLGRLQKLWNANGPKLLQRTSELLNSSFGYQVDTTGVFLCTSIPSMEQPRSISLWQFSLTTPEQLRWKDEEFVDVVFHEHLHMLMNRLLGWKFHSPMLEKYKDEALLTKMHLHLYAVQKATYESLGMTKEWNQIVARNKTFMRSYQRAVEIVNLEGSEPFVSELKKPSSE